MHFRQKLMFMALGGVLTLAGYLLATVVSDVTAQDNQIESLGHVVCDSITIRKGGTLHIYDENGTLGIAMGAGGIGIVDDKKNVRIGMSVTNDHGKVQILDQNGTVRTAMGEGGIVIVDDKKNVRIGMSVTDKTNSAELVLLDKSRKYRRVVITDDGDIVTSDRYGDVSGYLHKH